MIAGNQVNGRRHPTDHYPTDPRWTRVLLRHVQFTGPIWEPAAGSGAMVKVLEDSGYEVLGTDITWGTDFLQNKAWWPGAIVTNPPYSLLDEFVDHALELAGAEVAMLLPIGGLGGQRRYRRLWRERPPSLVIVVCNRMYVGGSKVGGSGVSQFNHAWVVWGTGGPSKIVWEMA